MKYILEYLAEEMFIQPVPGAEVKVIEEYAASDCPCVGRRLVINDRETDVVVWFADYDAWLEKKYDELNNKLQDAHSIIEYCNHEISIHNQKPEYPEEN